MSRSDAAWVDVLPQMKGFAAPLMKGVKEASKKAGTEGGRALADGISAEAKKADVSPVVRELEKVERAAKKTADEQANAAKKAASEVGKSQTRIIDARDKARSAAANVERAEADLEKRRATAASKSAEVEKAERDIAARRASGEESTEDLAKAELDLAGKRADSAKADAEVTASTAKLEGARTKLGQATEKVENEDIALRAAITESKVAHQEARDAAADHARAQEDLARETGVAAQEAEKALPAWKRLWSGMDGTGGLKKQIVNGMKGIGREVEKEAERIRSRGDALLGGIGKGVKWGAAGVAAGGAAFLGGAAIGGFNRLADIEDARASLEGLQMSGAEVDKVMESALASVKGTAFGMGEAASVAATMSAAGIKPGEELTDVLSLVADSATIAKRDIGDMGLIWSSVASKGKLQGDDAMQLLSSGIPIWDMVAEVMGVTSEQAQKLGSEGKVGFDVFAEAMETRLGGAAQKSGETVRGSFANLKAAVSRLGASALEDFYPLIAPALRGVTAFIDGIGEKVTPYIETFSDGVRGIYDLLVGGDFTGALRDAFGWEEDSPAVDMILRFRDGAKGLYDLLVKGDFTTALREAFGWEEDSPAVGALLMLRDAAIEVGGWLRDNLIPILSGVGGFLAYLGGTAVVGAIMSLGGVISGALATIGWIPLAIGAAVGVLTWFFTETELGAQVLETAWEGIKVAVGAVADWFTTTALPVIVAGFQWLQEAVGVVGEWFSTKLWPALQTGFEVLRAVADEVIPVVVDYAKTLGDYWSQIVVGVVIPALQQFAGYLQDTVFPIVQRLWTDYVQPAFVAIGGAAVWLWYNAVKPALSALSTFVTETLAPTIVWLWENVVSPAFSAIGSFIGWAWNSVIFPALDALKAFLTNVVGPTVVWLWQNVIVPAWKGISWAIDTAWAVIQVIFAAIDWTLRNVVGPVFTWLRDKIITPVWDGVKSTLETGWNFIRDHVFTPLKNFISDSVAPAFQTGVDAIGAAWEGLKSLAMAPVRFVVDSVINKGIIDNFNKIADTFGTDRIKHLPVPGMPTGEQRGTTRVGGGRTAAFATGGIMPGYTPGRDVHRFVSPTGGVLDLSGGEPVLRPEAGRVLGASWVHGINAAARSGGVSGVQSFLGGGHQALAGGGFISRLWGGAKDLAGDALDTLLKGWDFATEALSDPGGALAKIVDAVLGKMPGDGAFSDTVKKVPSKIASMIGDALSGLGDAVGGAPIGPAKGGGSLSLASQIASGMGLRMTSGYRRGARTAGTGSVSYHSRGRARDYAGPAGTMMRFFNAMHPYKPTELLYSPAGGRQWRRWGAQQNTSGVTRRNHFNHVHVAFRDGGMFGQRSWPAIQGYSGGGVLPPPVKPVVYDEGGWLKPGLSLVHNKSGRPEPVFTGTQGKSIIQMLERGHAPGGGDTFVVNTQEDRAAGIVSALMWEQKKRRRTGGKYAQAGSR